MLFFSPQKHIEMQIGHEALKRLKLFSCFQSCHGGDEEEGGDEGEEGGTASLQVDLLRVLFDTYYLNQK